MFGSRHSRHQHFGALSDRRRVRCTRARRLRVETMEGRLMLSAAPTELSPQVWQGAYATDVVGQLNLGAGQILPLSLSNDGGYVLFDTTRSNWQQSWSDQMIVRSTSITASDLDARGQLFTDAYGGVTGLGGFGLGGLSHTNVLVYPAGIDLTADANTGSVLTPQGSPSGQSEGGSIPIHAVLAGVRAEIAAGRPNVSSVLARRNPITTSPTRSDVALSAGGLSGEVGRAVVFEFAGGEPASSERSAKDDRISQLRVGDASQEGDGPLSMVEGRGSESTKSGDGGRAAQGDRSSPAGESQQNRVDPSRKQAAAGAGDVFGGKAALPIAQANWIHDQSGGSPDATDAVAVIGDADTSQLAKAAAFEQFGDDEAARVESTGTLWWRSWAVAPLLLALALEQIAARRSRHPQAETPRSMIRTPSRWPGLRLEDRD